MGWVVGVGLNIIGSLSINLSTNLIKLSHSRNHAATADHGLSPSPWRAPRRWWRHGGNRLWLIAMTIFVAGNLLNFASFAFAAQSLLSALGSVQFVSNVAFARLVNGERLTCWVAAGTIVIAAGCILLVAFGSHDSPTFTAAELQALYGGAGFIAYLSVGAVAVAAAYAIYRLGKRRVGGLRGQTLEGPWTRWLPLCYALFSGLPGTLSVLYGKSASILLRTMLAGDSQFGCWYTYFTGVLFIATSSFWMWRFNKALRLFPVSTMMPVLQVAWVMFSMLSGGLYFRELEAMSAQQAGMFGAGAAVLLAGIALLTTVSKPDMPPEVVEAELLGVEIEGSSEEGEAAAAAAAATVEGEKDAGKTIELSRRHTVVVVARAGSTAQSVRRQRSGGRARRAATAPHHRASL